MIAKTLVFVCAAFGLVSGSCFEFCAPQPCSQSCSQVISIPTTSECAPVVPSCVSECAPVIPSCVSECAPVVPSCVSQCAPITSCVSPCVSSCVSPCASPCAPVVISAPSCSDNCATEVFSSGCASESSSCCLKPGNGPETSNLPVIKSPCVTLPAVEGPTVTLCSPQIPAPRVIAQRCICTKTIVRPQVYERTVTVPRLQRYIKRTVTPVVENVAYKSTPITQESGSSSVYVPSGSNCGNTQSRVVISTGSSCCPRTC